MDIGDGLLHFNIKDGAIQKTITAVEQQDWDGFAKNYRAFINEDCFHLSQTVEPRFGESIETAYQLNAELTRILLLECVFKRPGYLIDKPFKVIPDCIKKDTEFQQQLHLKLAQRLKELDVKVSLDDADFEEKEAFFSHYFYLSL